VKVQIKGKKFDGIILDKRARTLYLAIADLNESLLEVLNRRTDKIRVKSRARVIKVEDSGNLGPET
jgi:hypothetical protein